MISKCPRFPQCSAPICPMDEDWERRSYIKGERVCFYLNELAKPGGLSRMRGSTAAEVVEIVLREGASIISRHAPIRRAIQRAESTPSRIGRAIKPLVSKFEHRGVI